LAKHNESICTYTIPPAFDINLLFLDIDGVLNTHEQNLANVASFGSHSIDRSMIVRINTIIRQVDLLVVIISAWRYMILELDMTPCGFENMMRSHGFQFIDTIIGCTCSDELTADRADQIRDFRSKYNHVGRFAIIDDLDLIVFPHNQIITNSHQGITDSHVQRAISILRGH
jgi:HAD domain in Swiss Army Knife RNA repair proteins